MKSKYTYSTKRDIEKKPVLTKNYLVLEGNKIVDGISLEKSKEVAKGLLSQNKRKRQYIEESGIYDSQDLPQNWKSSRRSADGRRYLDKGIQLYRLCIDQTLKRMLMPAPIL